MLLRTDPLADLFSLPRLEPPRARTAMNAYRHGDVITVQFDLPGIDPAAIDVQIERGELRLQARRTVTVPDGARFLVREQGDETISRRVMLGDVLDVEHVDAEYRDGVLTLRIPLHETAKPRQIAVKHTKADEPSAVPIESTAT